MARGKAERKSLWLEKEAEGSHRMREQEKEHE